jgi:hypothetical protein
MSVYPDRNGGTILVQTVTQIGEKRPRQENDRVAAKVLELSVDHSVKLFGKDNSNAVKLDSYTLPEGWRVSRVFEIPEIKSRTILLGESTKDQYGLFLAIDDEVRPVASGDNGFLHFYGAAADESGMVAFSALHEDDPPGMNVAGVYVWDGQSIRSVVRPGDDYSSNRVTRAFLFRGPLDLNRGIRMALDFGPDVVHSVIVAAKPDNDS